MNSQCEKVLFELSAVKGGPCVSIYMPTAHGKNGCDENILRFKNLKREALASLKSGYDDIIVQSFVKRLDAIERDTYFWNYQLGGLAIFMGVDYQQLVKLHRGVHDLAIVADRFHTKPLMRLYQSLDQFMVLAVTLNQARIFTGDRDGLTQEVAEDLRFSFDDYFGSDERDHQIGTVAVTGGSAPTQRGRSVYHNYLQVDARRKTDMARYFAAIDQVVCKRLSGKPVVPVILATLPEHQRIYREHSKIPLLLDKGILGNPDAMSVDDLRNEAWDVVRPYYEKLADQVSDEFRNAQLVGKGSDQLHDIARALTRGRVGKLLIEQDRQIPGRVVTDSGLILFADIKNPHVNDLLDDFADLVNHSSGEVVVLPPGKMPTTRGVAAIYRY